MEKSPRSAVAQESKKSCQRAEESGNTVSLLQTAAFVPNLKEAHVHQLAPPIANSGSSME